LKLFTFECLLQDTLLAC